MTPQTVAVLLPRPVSSSGRPRRSCQVTIDGGLRGSRYRFQLRHVHGGFHAALHDSCVLVAPMSPEEAFTAATWNAAWASGLGMRAGSLDKGFPADAVMFDVADYREVPYRFGWNTVSRVYKKGKEVWSKLLAVED